MKLVLESCDDIPEENGFGVIVNKVHPNVLKTLRDSSTQDLMLTKINAQLPKKTIRVYYNPLDSKLDSTNNVNWKADDELKMFVQSLTPVVINTKHVKEIPTESMEEIWENMELQMKALDES